MVAFSLVMYKHSVYLSQWYTFLLIILLCIILPSVPLPTPPSTFVQIGEPRTATTLQFYTICGALAVKYMSQPDVKIICGFKQWKFVPNRRENLVLVIKAHAIDDPRTKFGLLKMKQTINNSLVFLTARNYSNPPQKAVLEKNFGLRVAHIAVTTDVAQNGFRAGLTEYQRVFELSDNEMQILIEWLKVWSLLRICCGTQMSHSWRKQLAPTAAVACTSFRGNGTKNMKDPAIVTCSTQNLTEVEQQLMQTRLYREMRTRVPLLGKPSTRDSQLTGSYCQTCEENVRIHKQLIIDWILHWFVCSNMSAVHLSFTFLIGNTI